MNKNKLEEKLHQKTPDNPFTQAQCYNYLNFGPKNNLINDRYLYYYDLNTNATLNCNSNMISPIFNYQGREYINDPNTYNNSHLNHIYCSLTSSMNGDLNNNPITTHYYSTKYYKKNPFTPEEDEALLNFVKAQGIGNWNKISICMKEYNFDRNGRQCRDRYIHYLDPNIKMNCDWTSEEDNLIIKYVEDEGKKWKGMEKLFPGRTEVSLRNRYNLLIRKRVKEQRKTKKKTQLSYDTEYNIQKDKNYEISPIFDKLSKENESLNLYDFNDLNIDPIFDPTYNLEDCSDESFF